MPNSFDRGYLNRRKVRSWVPPQRPVGFGNDWATVPLTRTQYFGASLGNQWDQAQAVPGTDNFVGGVQAGAVGDRVTRLVPAGGGAQLAESGDQGANYQLAANTRYCFAFWSDRIFVSSRYNLGPGYIQVRTLATMGGLWSDTTGTSQARPIVADDAGLIYAHETGAAGGLFTIDGAAGSFLGRTSYNPGGGTIVSLGFSRDKAHLFSLAAGPILQIRAISGKPAPGAWAADVTVDLTSGDFAWTSIGATAYCVPARDIDGAVWVGQEAGTSGPNGTVYKIDAAGIKLAEFHPDDDTAMTSTALTGVRCDIAGFPYVVMTGGGSTAHAYKYTASGVLVTSTEAQGITGLHGTAAQLPLGFDITDITGYIGISNNDGELVTITPL